MSGDINGTGMAEAPNPEASGAEPIKPIRRNPSQGKIRSGIMDQRTLKIDRNRHGIRRETVVPPKKTGKPKKV